ncbi:catalase family protein [Bosea sp. 47.2.35]|uniref:catalase family protein n=1 Tax=Bosea sp. 47.2.35 TaxID=2969304 RepID=UPI0035B21D5E
MSRQSELPTPPLVYHPEFEQPEPQERATEDGLVSTLRSISETTFKEEGLALRSVHAKSHALLQGELAVAPDLPPELAQGLFSAPGRYPVIMRLSTIPGDVLDDDVSVPRGLAFKVIGVEGERLPGSENDVVQDFVFVNGPVFAAPTGKAFLGKLKLLAATTDKLQFLKKALSYTLRGIESAVEAVGGESATLKQLGAHPAVHPLGETYFSAAPILFGDYMAKVQLVPVLPELTSLTDQPVKVFGHPDGLREACNAFFAHHGGRWELRVQLCTDLETMPIEDASVEWPEEQSPYRTVATISAPSQVAWNEEKSRAIDDGQFFSPWHGLAAHRPLGSIMRLRKAAYRSSARFRSEHSGCPMHQPRKLEDVDLPA